MSELDAPAVVASLRTTFAEHADPERAAAMSAYLRDQFAFFGIGAPDRRALQRPILDLGRSPDPADVLALAAQLYEEPERELAHAACDLLVRHQRRLGPDAIQTVERLITTASWWDTVDVLAARVAGPVVLREPSLHDVPDRWIGSDDLWLRRTALIHQLHARDQLDLDRLFAYCERCAPESEFFIRKAIGWALRQAARTEPDAVRAFLDRMGDRLSGLSRREAAKHL